MLIDKRIEKLAHGLVDFSCDVQKGENVLIEATGVDYQLVASLVKEVYAKGAYPFVNLTDLRIKREWMKGMSAELAKKYADMEMYRMKDMQAYIAIRGGGNNQELSDVDLAEYNRIMRPVLNQRVNHTKWVVLRYPTEAMSQQAGMSTEAFEDFYFDVCTLDYSKMDKAMTPLVELMNRTDKVRIVAKDTDLTFSIKGIPAIKCSGLRNIPDGEVYTAPVKDSVNGYITYNVPSVEEGIKFENVRLEFKDGKIVNATANNTEAINKIFNTDDGARYVGEFALGVNPYITKAMGDILFDEKISGSIHFTPGQSYEDAPNGNKSAIHWDLVQVQTPEYGGGEIYFDDVLVRKDGLFVLDELKCLNPENLK